MKIDFKALGAGLLAAIVVSLIAHAHPPAPSRKAGGIAPSGDVAVQRG